MAETNPQKHLYDLLKGFSTAMLATKGADGVYHARPMGIAQLKPDAEAYFATDKRSGKVAEIEADPNVLVSFQSSSDYASICGVASIVEDRALIEQLWSEAWKVWFPAGKSDPNLVLIRVDTKVGEYWDSSGSEGIRYMFEGLKAYFQGRRPETDTTQHAKVRIA